MTEVTEKIIDEEIRCHDGFKEDFKKEIQKHRKGMIADAMASAVMIGGALALSGGVGVALGIGGVIFTAATLIDAGKMIKAQKEKQRREDKIEALRDAQGSAKERNLTRAKTSKDVARQSLADRLKKMQKEYGPDARKHIKGNKVVEDMYKKARALTPEQKRILKNNNAR